MQAVAFGKLQGILDSKPLNLPGKNILNLSMLAAVLTCGGLFLTTSDPGFGVAMLWATAAIGGVLGAHLTASIGMCCCSSCCIDGEGKEREERGRGEEGGRGRRGEGEGVEGEGLREGEGKG